MRETRHLIAYEWLVVIRKHKLVKEDDNVNMNMKWLHFTINS